MEDEQIVTDISVSEAAPVEAAPKKRGRKLIGDAPLTGAQRKARHDDKKKAASYVYDSSTVPTKAEAKHQLEVRGLKDTRVIDTVYDLLNIAAEKNGVPPNRFLFANGVKQTLLSYEAKEAKPLAEIPDEPVVGQLSNLAELVAIHDASIAWREDAFNFEEFLRLRKVCKTDAFGLGKLLDKDFEECCQGEWAKFLPRFNPDTLSPKYSQKEMRMWLDSISPVKDYLLMASRNSMKSSFVLVWLITLHLCAPDARALLVSETQKLSSGFIRAYRNYWEVQPNSETMLQKLFPEYCIKPGEGSELYFRSPMAHLNLIQPSASKSSAETAETGGRAEVIIEDDIISNLTVGSEEQIQKSINVHSLLQKLREVLGSFTVVIGTPWARNDLYATLLKQAESDEVQMASRIDPIVKVKPHALQKLTPALLSTLKEEDVESYLLPVRMPWRFVKKEIAANPTFALSQNFCVFPQSGDDEIRILFSEDDLNLHVRQEGYFSDSQLIETVVVCDPSFSTSANADPSAIISMKTFRRHGKTIAVVNDCFIGKLKQSELAVKLVEFIQKHQPSLDNSRFY